MKRIILAVAVAAMAFPLVAQQSAADDSKTVVAQINAETITLAQLDALYDSLPIQMREQYDKNGGKSAFLDNYMRKRLIIQEAIKQGFDQRRDVQAAERAATENVLFDRYVRDVVADTIVTPAMMRQYYDDHQSEFARPEQVKARHIIVTSGGGNGKTKEQALAEIRRIYDDLSSRIASAKLPDAESQLRFIIHTFDATAREFSEDGTSKQGGDLGWFGRGVMAPEFEKVAFSQTPGTISAPFESPFGYHIVLVEGKRPAGTTPYEEVRSRIREQLLAQHGAEILQKVTVLTNQLRNTGKIAVFPENIR